MQHNNPTRGFIALITIIVISTVLLVSTLSLAQFGIASRFSILNLEQKAQSEKHAEACIETARITLFNNPLYSIASSAPQDIPVGNTFCTIYSVTTFGKETTIETKGRSGDAVTNLRVILNTQNNTLLSWQELPRL